MIRTPSRVAIAPDDERGGRSGLSPLDLRFESSLSFYACEVS
jgi:hypothetical protein